MIDETLVKYFQSLDNSLSELGLSDSSIEYANHIRDRFNEVVNDLNKVKMYLGGSSKSSDSYFN